MRVLFVNADPGVPVYGPKGASVHVRAMADALARAGHEVIVIAARTGEPPVAVPPRFLLMPGFPEPPRGLGAADAEAFALDRDEELLERLRGMACRLHPDLVYERHSLWCEAGVALAGELGIPHALEVNAPLIEESARFRSLYHRDEADEIARHVFSGTTVALVVSRAVAAYARRHGARRLRWFPNAVDPAHFPGGPRPPVPGELALGFCGSLKPWHGLEELIEVLARVRRRVPGAVLRVLGDGPGRGALEAAADRLGVRDALELDGTIEHDEVPAWLERLDVALAPYPALDAFWFSPLKIFEYQAAGLPVITTRQGDLPLIVEHGRTGVLVEPGDLDGMAEWALALHRDRALASALGAAARAEVFQRHTWERRVRELEEAVASPADRPEVRA